MSRRGEIEMDDAELGAFLREQRTLICATNGRDGWPHLMPLWFVLREGDIWAWTYAASQKVRNLERDARATLTLEAGKSYEELRGAMLKAEVAIERETAFVEALGLEIYERYVGAARVDGQLRASVARQAPKRVALHFLERSRATFDHRKLRVGA